MTPQTPEPGWPAWANTPAKRAANAASQRARNTRISHTRKVPVFWWPGRGRLFVTYVPRKYR